MHRDPTPHNAQTTMLLITLPSHVLCVEHVFCHATFSENSHNLPPKLTIPITMFRPFRSFTNPFTQKHYTEICTQTTKPTSPRHNHLCDTNFINKPYSRLCSPLPQHPRSSTTYFVLPTCKPMPHFMTSHSFPQKTNITHLTQTHYYPTHPFNPKHFSTINPLIPCIQASHTASHTLHPLHHNHIIFPRSHTAPLSNTYIHIHHLHCYATLFTAAHRAHHPAPAYREPSCPIRHARSWRRLSYHLAHHM